jgi:hypothetical protein
MTLTPDSTGDETRRTLLVAMAFDWERRFGIATVPLSKIAEHDVCRLLGLPDEIWRSMANASCG